MPLNHLLQFSVPQIEYPLGGSSKKGSYVYFLLMVAMVLLLWYQIVLLWHQVTMVSSEQHLHSTIAQFDKTMVLPRKRATGSILDYMFRYCPLVGVLFEILIIIYWRPNKRKQIFTFSASTMCVFLLPTSRHAMLLQCANMLELVIQIKNTIWNTIILALAVWETHSADVHKGKAWIHHTTVKQYQWYVMYRNISRIVDQSWHVNPRMYYVVLTVTSSGCQNLYLNPRELIGWCDRPEPMSWNHQPYHMRLQLGLTTCTHQSFGSIFMRWCCTMSWFVHTKWSMLELFIVW